MVNTHLLAQLVTMAAVDSVNPCTFYIYTVLLLAVAAKTRSPRSVAAAALAFTAAVYVGYLVIGLALFTVAVSIPAKLLAVAAAAYGGYTIGEARMEAELRKRGIPLEKAGGRLGRKAVAATAAGLAAVAGLGLLVSFTLLPCSGGPLAAFIIAMAASGCKSLACGLPYLLLYNLVFVAPLLAIGAAAAAAYRVQKLQRIIEQHAPQLNAIAGALLIGVALYVLYTT